MAKAVILDVLESTIGRFVLNLDAQSLNVAVWKGQIVLNSLRLDVDAVNRELARKAAEAPHLAIPFRVVDGSLDHIQVDVPWARITSKPVVLRASGLDVLIEPFDHLAAGEVGQREKVTDEESSEEDASKKPPCSRINQLAHADKARCRLNAMREITDIDKIRDDESNDSLGQERNTTSGFKERLVRRIIENMQLEIDGVKLGLRGNGYSAGIVFSLSILTTDEDGNQTYVDRVTSSKNPMKSFLNKVLKLKGFGVHCNEVDSFRRAERIESDDRTNFILSPLSFEARLRQSDCVKCVEFPKYLLCVEIPTVSIIFSRNQLELLSNVAHDIAMKRNKSRPLFPEYRPVVPISKTSAKLWWKYAVRCVGRVNRRRSWAEFFIAFQKRKAYVSLYKRYAHHSSCSWLKMLSSEELQQLQDLEKDRTISIQGIMSWRNIVDAQVAYERREYERQSGQTNTSPLSGSGIDLLGELETLAALPSSTADTLSSDSKLWDIRFILGSLKVDLFTFDSHPLASLELGKISTCFKANTDGAFDASFSIASFNLYDRISYRSLFPIVVKSLQSIDSTVESSSLALSLGITRCCKGDLSLKMRLVSVEVVGSTDLMREMKRFLTPPERGIGFTAPTPRPSLEGVLPQRNRMNIDIHIATPVFLLHDEMMTNNLLVFNLGSITFKSVHDDLIPVERANMNFGEWICSMDDVKVFCTAPDDNVRAVPEVCLVEPFTLSCMIRRKGEGKDLLVKASSPKIVFNLTSTSVRFVKRMLLIRRMRKEKQPGSLIGWDNTMTKKRKNQHSGCFEFQFALPITVLRLTNDIDGRDGITPILEARIEEIRLALQSSNGSRTYHVRTKSFNVKDCYQHAGDDFSSLITSVAGTTSDSLTVRYESAAINQSSSATLSIDCHDTRMQWNPETISAVHKAIQLTEEEQAPIRERPFHVTSTEMDESLDFFDAIELDSKSSDSDYYVCETHSLDDVRDNMGVVTDENLYENEQEEPTNQTRHRRITITFQLLQIDFNKDSRHRKLFRTQMSNTFIRYESKPEGGYVVRVVMNNFTMNDPACDVGHTLYGDILGLQKNVKGTTPMLEVMYQTFHRVDGGHKENGSVKIDPKSMTITGCDSDLSMRFHTPRIVFLQQLWMEIVDYFFEAMLGDRVWGRTGQKKPCQNDHVFTLDPTSTLPGSDAPGIRFLRFSVSMNSPVIILPVTYRSPQHLRLAFENLTVSNLFNGQIEVREDSGSYVQWYNNYNMKFSDFRLSSWCGAQLNLVNDPKVESCQIQNSGYGDLNFSIRWPIGNTAANVVPKWNVKCSPGNVSWLNNKRITRLLLRKCDYALFQHVVGNNFGEESRHLDEWKQSQSLEPAEIEEYRRKIMVHFGYDKKDGPPTTYSFQVETESFILHFCSEENEHISDIICSGFEWSIKKHKDQISRQRLVCNRVEIHETSGNVEWARYGKLLLPLHEFDNHVDSKTPQLIYTSTSRRNGDNAKHLELTDTCIHMIYPAWVNVRTIFSDLPSPDLMAENEVLSSVQVGDRWYRMKTNEGLTNGLPTRSIAGNTLAASKYQPTYQFRVVFVSSRIICCSDASEQLILRASHFDFLRDISGETTSRTFFLHDLEVFCGSADIVFEDQDKKSLLCPLSASGGVTMECKVGEKEAVVTKWLSSDVISTRVAYSDIALATDVVLKNLRDLQQVKKAAQKEYQNESSVPDSRVDLESIKQKETFGIACAGFDLVVTDDSGRHFAASQELVQISFCSIRYNSTTNRTESSTDLKSEFHLGRMEVIDLLQESNSPFRVVATSSNGDEWFSSDQQSIAKGSSLMMKDTIFNDLMTWEHYSMEKKDWGFHPSTPMLNRVEICLQTKLQWNSSNQKVAFQVLHSSSSIYSNDYRIKIGPLVIQWNPSMVIAMQRFLGRLRKETKSRYERILNNNEENRLVDKEKEPTSIDSGESRCIRAEISLDSLTFCLNKEHQKRRLLQTTISESIVKFEKDLRQINIDGSAGDINVWDSDGDRYGQVPICRSNRLILRMSDDSDQFVSFRYHARVTSCSRSRQLEEKEKHRPPQWVLYLIGKNSSIDSIDDCLSLSIASVRFNYIRERTGEIMDYLSNGLPGKGMGATSRAAKGFIQKRIKTQSVLNLKVRAPQLFLPRNRGVDEGIFVSLGDVSMNSWFDESTLDESESIETDTLNWTSDSDFSSLSRSKNATKDGDEMKHWWRALSIVVCGIGWRVVERNEDLLCSYHVQNPVNVHVLLRKPPTNDLPTILRSRVSCVGVFLKYSDYVLCRSVLRENLAKTLDMSFWDNKEKAYSFEDEGSLDELESLPSSHNVKYSKSARFVRYGDAGRVDIDQTSVSSNSSINKRHSSPKDSKVFLEGLNLTLHRNDMGKKYDIILLQVGKTYLSTTRDINQNTSSTIKFFKIALYDAGNTKETRSTLRKPCAFSVIAESGGGFDSNVPHFGVSIHTGPSSLDEVGLSRDLHSSATVVTVEMNSMNINPMIHPLLEVYEFFTCGWSTRQQNPHVGRITFSDELEEAEHVADEEMDNEEMLQSSVVKIKLVAHNPHVFLLADESDPLSRALVLRGFVEVHLTMMKNMMSNPLKNECHNTHTETSLSVNFDKLESYINPNVGSVLGQRNCNGEEMSKEKLGVALIEPLTAGIEIHKLQRERYPTSRSVSMKMEPVSTMLSFEDIRLVEMVLSRWKAESGWRKAKDTSNDEASFSTNPSFKEVESSEGVLTIDSMQEQNDIMNEYHKTSLFYSQDEGDTLGNIAESSLCCGGCMPGEVFSLSLSNKEATDAPIDTFNAFNDTRSDVYEMVFESEKLGLILRKAGSLLLVDKVTADECIHMIDPGDQVISIAGKSISGMQFHTILRLLDTSARPMSIMFRRKSPERYLELKESYSKDHIVITQPSQSIRKPRKRHVSRTPTMLTKHHMTTISFRSGYTNGMNFEQSLCGGATVVQDVNDALYKEAIVFCASERGLRKEYRPPPGSIVLALNNKPTCDLGYTETVALLKSMQEGEDLESTYTISFLEAASEDWGYLDSVDIIVSGIKLTLIDDVSGRDMPLLRITLNSLGLKLERGLGLQCNSIKVSPPSLLTPCFENGDVRGETIVRSDLSDVITKLCCSAEILVDYYNARVAVWEPLLESCHLNFELEWQKGSMNSVNPHSESISFAISDYREPSFNQNEQSTYICFNVTDAAAENLLTAAQGLRSWQKPTHPSSEQDVEDKKSSAQKAAAQAALIFATRRGVESKKADVAKPFVLRNKTGMRLSFVSQAPANYLEKQSVEQNREVRSYYDLNHFKSSAIIEVDRDGESRFDLDIISSDEMDFSKHDRFETEKDEKIVRSYDGNFPLLSLALHSNETIEVLKDMSAVKVGKSLQRLQVGSASILVAWAVELESNQRVITISGAVSIASPKCAIPIAVGTRRKSIDESDVHLHIDEIGLSTHDSPFYLPLWLDLRFKETEIFVRPSGMGEDRVYKWSATNVLELKQISNTEESHLPNTWVWNSNDEACILSCEPLSAIDSGLSSPLFLSWSESSNDSSSDQLQSVDIAGMDDVCRTLCLSISSSLTIRNCLPEDVEWEVCDTSVMPADNGIGMIIDGSPLRKLHEKMFGVTNYGVEKVLERGKKTDILSCDCTSMTIAARFRCVSNRGWSDWVTIRNVEDTEQDSYFEPVYKNIHVKDSFDAPLAIGVKIVPKVSWVNSLENRSSRHVSGFDVLLYSDLWLHNLTSLPIVFGAPSSQICSKQKWETYLDQSDDDSDLGRRMAAEVTLMELSSVFEFGDRGKGFKTDLDDVYMRDDIYILPKQQSDEVIEEIFEYIHIQGGLIKRRWWSSEQPLGCNRNCERKEMFSSQFSTQSEWRWAEGEWNIDITGTCGNHDGWETCNNLQGSKDKTFCGERIYEEKHPFRRRRWFRRKVKQDFVKSDSIERIAFHQPILKPSGEQNGKPNSNNDMDFAHNQGDKGGSAFLDTGVPQSDDSLIKLCFKVRDGCWSETVEIPRNGPAHGVVRIFGSRWPALSKNVHRRQPLRIDEIHNIDSYPVKYKSGCLSPRCYDLSYKVSVTEGLWGEYSRNLMLSPRFFIRNDSKRELELRQVGSPEHTSMKIKAGDVQPFYWTDMYLPELLCVRPTAYVHESLSEKKNKSIRRYKWSGGFDICSLGMVPLRVREDTTKTNYVSRVTKIIRAFIEIRSGTGGTGITVSFKEESPDGEDSLYRIENHTLFPLWISQDGVLANPFQDSFSHHHQKAIGSVGNGASQSTFNSNGDLVPPNKHVPFGLDVPFRQGKYASREAIPLEELLRIRVGLAPLSSRDGIESTKVISLSLVGEVVSLKPSRLRHFLDDDVLEDIVSLRILGRISTDGPTRVLRFSMIQASTPVRASMPFHSIPQNETKHVELKSKLKSSALEAIKLMKSGDMEQESEYRKSLLDEKGIGTRNTRPEDICDDRLYSFRASFSGFVFSLIDSFPSEIAVVSFRKIDAMASWNRKRTDDATTAISIGWMQIDNHCPNATFPVAFSPDVSNNMEDSKESGSQDPFLSLGMVLAPKHKSSILCLKGLTIVPSNLAIGFDLAFMMRVQFFLMGLYEHFERTKVRPEYIGRNMSQHTGDELSTSIESWTFPDLSSVFRLRTDSAGAKIGSRKMHFETFTIIPFNIKLSVAPAVGLASTQAALEGKEAAAIHAAVRKGDFCIGDGAGVLGVKIGSKNRTFFAVLRGLLKSILVDGLLRFDGASMNFSGIILQHYLSSLPQLKTFIGAHYLASLKSNVPALLGSLGAFGNPVGLIRGFGDGVTDFVSEPVKGLRRSVEELDPSYIVNGVARGTGSLARNTFGGIVDSASLLTETFSKNMAVLTLDRNYAQRRDRFKALPGSSITLVSGFESGVEKLIRGVAEGVIGVVQKPMRGAERTGVSGFAKGVGKGLLGLIFKPVIGISDAVTDVMVGVKGTIDGTSFAQHGVPYAQIRPRRCFFGEERVLTTYNMADALSMAIIMNTRLAGENYLSHCDLGGRVALLSVKKFLLLGDDGEEQLIIKFKNMSHAEVRQVPTFKGSNEWAVIIFLSTPRKNGNEVEVIQCEGRSIAFDLCSKINLGVTKTS